jgi:hypothetical protein
MVRDRATVVIFGFSNVKTMRIIQGAIFCLPLWLLQVHETPTFLEAESHEILRRFSAVCTGSRCLNYPAPLHPIYTAQIFHSCAWKDQLCAKRKDMALYSTTRYLCYKHHPITFRIHSVTLFLNRVRLLVLTTQRTKGTMCGGWYIFCLILVRFGLTGSFSGKPLLAKL